MKPPVRMYPAAANGYYAMLRPLPPRVAKLLWEPLNLAALNTPAVKARYAQLGATVVGSTPAELATFLQDEIDRWGPIIKAAGIKPE